MNTRLFLILAVLLFGALGWVSCEKTYDAPNVFSTAPAPGDGESSFSLIQTEVFDKQCISCHTAGTSFATQSDLVLTADVSYEQLIDRRPKNTAAREDGLMLVGSKGLASVHKSYLWEKINARNQEHLYADHPLYGAIMPLGQLPLTDGQFKLIEEWIKAGAPKTGVVVDKNVLLNTERYEQKEFQPLPLPQSGIQLHLGPFEVPPNHEREFYYFEPLNNNEDIFINRIEISLRSGSHHFIAYRLADYTPASFIDYLKSQQMGVIRDIRDLNGNYIVQNLLATQYHEFLAGTQWPLMNYHFPAGVALRIPTNSYLDLNPHYVNRTNEMSQGELYANLHTVEPSEVRHVAEILNLGNFDISLPPNRETTLKKTFTFNQRRHIFQMFSHAHEHMTEFSIYVSGGPRDGELVYIAYDWEHPPILQLDPPLTLEAGQGLRLETTYNNWTSRTLHFGLLSEDEMMFLFGAYYLD